MNHEQGDPKPHMRGGATSWEKYSPLPLVIKSLTCVAAPPLAARGGMWGFRSPPNRVGKNTHHYHGLQFFPDDRKPTGKSKKPSGIVFLSASRQQTADRNSSTGKAHYSWRAAVRKQFLTAALDGLGYAGEDQLLSIQPSGNPDRNSAFLSCQYNPSGKDNLAVRKKLYQVYLLLLPI